MTLASCQKQQERVNPLLTESNQPFGIVNFDDVQYNDYREALAAGMKAQNEAIEAIINNPEEATFANTIEPYDKSDEVMGNAMGTFYVLSSCSSNDSLRALQKEFTPLTSAHRDNIAMNAKLFERVKHVYEVQNKLGIYNGEEPKEILNHEQKQALEKIYNGFKKSGAELSAEDQEKLKALNLKLSELQLEFSQCLLFETNNTYVTVDTKEELKGLPEANIEQAAAMAKAQGQEGKYMFNMQRPSCNPVLQYCENRELRKKVYNAYYNRCNTGNQYDTKAICAQIVNLRLERAKLMGYKNCAEQILQDRMAKNQENVYSLLDAVWGPAVAKAKEELADIRVEMKKDGINEEPEGWDYMYYSSRAKAVKYNIDEEQLSEYFEIHNVLKGIFYTAEKLYGLTFKEITDKVPSYEKEAQAWEVIDKDGKTLAVFYSDYYPRDGKRAGAWCTAFRGQGYKDGKRVEPIVQNVCNMTIGSAERPGLQSMDNVETMFHEFGHALHSFMRDVHYDAISGVERDMVELPSQINEHWATEPEVLQVYAKHYKTGEVIPADLLKKLDESGKYGQGFATVEYLAASYVDMDLHVLTEVPTDLDVIKFEEKMLAQRGIPRQIQPRYRITNFSHTMGGGYTAGYYCYLWSEVLDCDAFEVFKNSGDIFNQEIAANFRKYVLTPGGIDDGLTMYRNFCGHEPQIDALLRKRGLSAAACR